MKNILVIVVFSFFVISCNEKEENLNQNSNVEFYKFFDPFTFKGFEKIDSTSKDFPFYKLYYDSLNNIAKIDEYLFRDEVNTSKVRNVNNVKIILDSNDGAFQDEVVMSYSFFFDKKVVSIYNFLYTKSGRTYTSFLNIYTPNKVLEYSFFGDGKINEPEIDSIYLKKITFITPESILLSDFYFDTSYVNEKWIRYMSNTQNEIIVKTLFNNKDTSVNQTFNYSNKKFDNFWVAKYNFFDSIAPKLYWDKHYKSILH